MIDEQILIDAKCDKNTIVSDFIRQYKGSQAEFYDLVVNDQVIPRNTAMRDAIVVKFQERQIKFTVSHSTGSIPIEFGLTKTVKSLKENLRAVKKVSVDTLTFNGNNLNDDTTLKDCEIFDGSVVHIKEKTVFDLIMFFKDENSADYYDLAVDGKVIPRTKTLREAGISETSKFELVNRKITFIIKTLTGRTIKVELYSTDTILIVKKYVAEREGIMIDQQRLIFEKIQRNDEATLFECGIRNGSHVFLEIRLLSCRGGCPK